jgi:DNA helicase-4
LISSPSYVADLLDDHATRDSVLEFFAYYLHPYQSPFEFGSMHEYYQSLRGRDLRTLRGELVKSHEELLIANWLRINGVAYEYESDYRHETASIQHRQYRPDFYLPQYDLYIEHLGVDRKGNTAPGVDPQQYHEATQWKRATHAKFGTSLVETYSYERMEGSLTDALAEKLRAAGIVSQPLPPEAIREDVEKLQLVKPLVSLLRTFLNLYKGNLFTLDGLKTAAGAKGEGRNSDPLRSQAFLRVFELVFAAYERDLRSAGEIDFNDMIAQAKECVSSGGYRSAFTRVIVDEFQDLSRGRALLLRALLDQVPDRRLFCVGDDWQSIYRFTGSDIAQMQKFQYGFGYAHEAKLQATHRLNGELLNATEKFVQKNPYQIPKKLHAASGRRVGGAAVEIHEVGRNASANLDAILKRIAEKAVADTSVRFDRGEKASVLVLGRYRHTLPEDRRDIERRHTTLSIRCLTVHTSKGLEADYVVLLDVISGKSGFPSEFVDDPILQLVLAASDDFPNAEERRLFYVALTRAKHRAFVLTDPARCSKFVDELRGPEYTGMVHRRGGGLASAARCEDCGGPLIRRAGPHGEFWGCVNYPLCDGTAKTCNKCERSPMVRDKSRYLCANHQCGATIPICPSCGVGQLRIRQGPRGTFFGCSEYRPDGAGESCRYTLAAQPGVSH